MHALQLPLLHQPLRICIEDTRDRIVAMRSEDALYSLFKMGRHSFNRHGRCPGRVGLSEDEPSWELIVTRTP